MVLKLHREVGLSKYIYPMHFKVSRSKVKVTMTFIFSYFYFSETLGPMVLKLYKHVGLG